MTRRPPRCGALALALLALGCGAPAPSAERAPDLVIVSWDTARADHVGPGAAVPGLTPHWNRFAQEGVWFTAARTPSPTTLPAHATLLTGLLPPSHGARNNGLFRLSPAARTLAERLSAAGWSSGAFVSAAVLDAEYGLARGFDAYDDRVGEQLGRDFAARPADATVDAALAWLARQPAERPVFLWVHLFDPHQPYDAPPHLAKLHPEQPYRAEIAFADEQTGRLLEGLRAAGRLDHALVALTADHGEGLGEHGELTHGYFLYDSTLRIPLCLWAGRASGAALRRAQPIDAPVSLADLVPTFLELLGQPGAALDGRSLLPLIAGAEWPARELALESLNTYYLYGAAPIFGVLDAPGELWIDLPRRERYRMRSDPGQTDNLYHDADAQRADALFARHARAWPPAGEATELDPAQAERLAALGYTTGRPLRAGSASAEALPDPKDLLPVAGLWMGLTPAQNPARALAEAERLVARFGPLPVLAFYRADRLFELVRPLEAIDVLREASRAHPADRGLAQELAEAVATVERDRELAARIRAALAAQPDHPGAHHDLAVVLHRLGELAEAEPLYRRWLQRHPDDVESRVAFARLLGARGDYTAALELLRDGGAAPQLACAEGRLLAWWMERHHEARAPLRRCRDGGAPITAEERRLLAADADAGSPDAGS